MAEPFDRLMQVQEHDTTLDQLRHRVDTLPERAELAEAGRRRAALGEAIAGIVAQVEDLTTRQRLLEEQIAAAAHRRHEIEQRMRSGEISASRDLQAMDQEVQHLGVRQSRLEEEELALLEEEDPLDTLLAEQRRAATALAAEVDRLTAAVTVAEADIAVSIGAEETLRAERAGGLPDELARRYELLRSRLGGVGAARLVGDRCDGCHLTMSSVEVERIRHLPPEEFATCDQCDRILVH